MHRMHKQKDELYHVPTYNMKFLKYDFKKNWIEVICHI
jgi:hypothetical protein